MITIQKEKGKKEGQGNGEGAEKPVFGAERMIPRMVFPIQQKVNSEFFRMQIKSGFC